MIVCKLNNVRYCTTTLKIFCYTYLFVLLRLLPQTKSGDFAKRILRLIPSERLSAEDALAHEYFASLPPALFTLPDSKWLFEYVLYNSYFISLSLSLSFSLSLSSFAEASIFLLPGVLFYR